MANFDDITLRELSASLDEKTRAHAARCGMTVAAMASIPEAMDELSGRYDAGSETIVKSLLLAGKYHEVGKAPAAPEIFAGKLDFENDPAAAKKATIVL